MEVPPHVLLEEGVYAVWVHLGGAKYMGSLHYGPVPVFGEEDKSLEVFLLDAAEKDFSTVDTSEIGVTPVKRLRDVQAFPNPDKLVIQIQQDVADVRRILYGVAGGSTGDGGDAGGPPAGGDGTGGGATG